MRSRRRRRWDLVWAVAAAVVALLVAGAGGGIGDQEHITRIHVSATLDPETGDLQVVEAIDYDFGLAPRHGIYRDIPDLDLAAPLSVSSPTAPDEILVSNLGSQTRIRVGNPAQTITRLHRYEISFTLDGDAIVAADSREIAWAAVGTGWTVPIDEVEVLLAVPFGLTDTFCRQTGTFNPADCTIEALNTGVVRVEMGSMSPGTGLTIIAGIADPIADWVAPAKDVVLHDVDDPGSGLVPPGLLAGLAALIGAVPAAIIVRRAGREQVWIGGSADAAHGPADDDRYERVTEAALGEFTTIEFEAPRGMSAVEGGILIDERVLDRHQTAWLLESAIRDEIELDGSDADDLRMRIGSSPTEPHSAQILAQMFGRRESISLDSHDSKFQAGWNRLEAELDGWRRESDHWDPHYRRTRALAIGGGVAVLAAGLILTFVGGWQANRWGSNLWMAAAGGAAIGFGAAVLIRSWELHVRTPQGSARWLQIESFRRFLHESEAHHVEYAADKGLLRQYTAWAVALDETDAWTDAVAAAVTANPGLETRMGSHIAFAATASSFSRATSVASTTPSSSGSGGGGGGGGRRGRRRRWRRRRWRGRRILVTGPAG